MTRKRTSTSRYSAEIGYSRLLEKNAASIVDAYHSYLGTGEVHWVGETQLHDFTVAHDGFVKGAGEVKADIDPRFMRFYRALHKGDLSQIALSKGLGHWGCVLSLDSNLMRVEKELPALIGELASRGMLTFDTEQNWHEDVQTLRASAQRIGLRNTWFHGPSEHSNALIMLEPWGGLVPEQCPPLQGWVDLMIGTHKNKASFSGLLGNEQLIERHLFFWVESASPLELRQFVLYHANRLPSEELSLPIGVTHFWVGITRAFQTGDFAWLFEPESGWSLLQRENGLVQLLKFS